MKIKSKHSKLVDSFLTYLSKCGFISLRDMESHTSPTTGDICEDNRHTYARSMSLTTKPLVVTAEGIKIISILFYAGVLFINSLVLTWIAYMTYMNC